jgi:hypothetical protein
VGVSGARLRRVGELDVDDETAALLLKIALATIDRRLAASLNSR